MTISKNFNQAAENNKKPISEILDLYLNPCDTVLEIGSGTGQHIAFFANIFPNIIWQPSDLPTNQALNHLNVLSQDNILSPKTLDIGIPTQWPSECYDVIYTANTCHIMSYDEVKLMIELAGSSLRSQGYFICYGPFKFNGQFTTQSNKEFDTFLKQQKITMGLRDFESIQQEAHKYKLKFIEIHDMPANNHILVFQS